MVDVVKSRRAFFRTLAATAVGGAAGALTAGEAAAFRLLPADDYAAMLENSCVADSQANHRQILDDVKKELGIDLTEEEAQKILAQMSCPFCGCNLQQALQTTTDGAF